MVNSGLFHTIDACRICRCTDLPLVIDLGEQALTGLFPRLGEPDPPKAPLAVIRCAQCGLVQLRHSVTPDVMFTDGYGYRSGVNATMRAHLSSIAAEVSKRARLRPGDAVLDIGCNDGTLLMAHQTPGLRRFGIDPVAEMFRSEYSSGLQINAGTFNARFYREISGLSAARGITTISMFYDLEDPSGFVADVAAVLAADGVWVLEQSYLPRMLKQNSFDTICHEHLEYYALAQIDLLIRRHQLRIFDVKLNDINGGSFQVWICHAGADFQSNWPAIDALMTDEQNLELATDKPYAMFRLRVASIGRELREFIAEETSRRKSIYVYGASTKGNVLLQYFGLDAKYIRGCADKNPLKWGRRTPGTGIPIVSEEAARASADYFLVLPWHFRDEFLAREVEFRTKGGKFIFPLPRVEIC